MGNQMTVGDAVRKNEVFGYEYVIENGEIVAVSFRLNDGTEFVLPTGLGVSLCG